MTNALQRNHILERIGWALATLRSAGSTISIGEDIEGCQESVERARTALAMQIKTMRFALDDLERLDCHDPGECKTTTPPQD
jgi:hypothetical protein